MRGLFTGLGLGGLLLGCYSLHPVREGQPEIGSQVAFDLNDAGRLELGPKIGSEVGQIEGRLLAAENGEYLLAVTAVRSLRGGEQVWSGEQVRVKREHVGPPQVRRFDKTRSVAVGGTVVGGFAAFLIGRALTTGGSEGRTPPVDTGAAHRGRP